jgi:hypothetical protein
VRRVVSKRFSRNRITLEGSGQWDEWHKDNGTIAQAADGKTLSWRPSKCDVTHIARRQGAFSA